MTYTKITIKINTKDKPPYFMGSQLRGAFGYALKSVVGNENEESNLFYKFYKEENSQRAFRFDYKLGQYKYDFSFYLFSKYCDEVFNIVSTFHEMLTKIGLGKEQRKYDDFEIFINKKIVYKDGNLVFPSKYKKKIKIKQYLQSVSIELKTPLRIKKDGKLVRNSSLELEDILTSIYKKIKALESSEVYNLEYKPRYKYLLKDIYFKDLNRYSIYKETQMKFGGMVGYIEVKNLDKKSYELLKIGEIIGVGKETSFGLGKILLKEIDE